MNVIFLMFFIFCDFKLPQQRKDANAGKGKKRSKRLLYEIRLKGAPQLVYTWSHCPTELPSG